MTERIGVIYSPVAGGAAGYHMALFYERSDGTTTVIVVCTKPIPAKTVGNPPEFSARLRLSVKPYCVGASRLGIGS